MTVGELRARLARYPDEAPAYVWHPADDAPAAARFVATWEDGAIVTATRV